MSELWIFAYGSLIWDPGFAPADRLPARLHGWQRRFCMASIHYRGTREAPGLVLALDETPGATCDGVAFRVRESEEETVLEGLRARELISDAYTERRLPVALSDRRTVTAVAYVIHPSHAQYCSHAAPDQARIIANASGARGPNRDYLFQTAQHLHALGIPDPGLDDLVARVRRLTGDAAL